MAPKPLCIIPRCGSRNKEVHSHGWCKNHYNSWLKYGDPLRAVSRAPKGSGPPKSITIKSLKELNLFNAFDVSRWCVKHGIKSVYLEYRGRELMEVGWVHMTESKWVAMDATLPGKALKKFMFNGATSKEDVFKRASAWVEAVHGTSVKPLYCLNAAFPAPAVDLLLNEIETLRKVQSLDPVLIAEVPQETFARVVEEYRIPQKKQAPRKASV